MNMIGMVNIIKPSTCPKPTQQKPPAVLHKPSEGLTLITVEDLAGEARLAHLPVDLEPAFLGEDGAEVSEEALHAFLTLLG